MKKYYLPILLISVGFITLLFSCKKEKEASPSSNTGYFNIPLEKKCRTVHVSDSLDSLLYDCLYNTNNRIQLIHYFRNINGGTVTGGAYFNYTGNRLEVKDTLSNGFGYEARSSTYLVSDAGKALSSAFYDARGFFKGMDVEFLSHVRYSFLNDGTNYISRRVVKLDSLNQPIDTVEEVEWTYYQGTNDRYRFIYSNYNENLQTDMLMDFYIPDIYGKGNTNLLKSAKITRYPNDPNNKQVYSYDYTYDLDAKGNPIKIKVTGGHYNDVNIVRKISYEQCD